MQQFRPLLGHIVGGQLHFFETVSLNRSPPGSWRDAACVAGHGTAAHIAGHRAVHVAGRWIAHMALELAQRPVDIIVSTGGESAAPCRRLWSGPRPRGAPSPYSALRELTTFMSDTTLPCRLVFWRQGFGEWNSRHAAGNSGVRGRSPELN